MCESGTKLGTSQIENSLGSKGESSKGESIFMQFLIELEQIIFNLNEENFNISIHQAMNLFDPNFTYSFNIAICILLYSAFSSLRNDYDLYFKFLKSIQSKEEELNINNIKIFDIFGKYISKFETQEAYFLIERMIMENLINKNITSNIKSKYFAHYKTEKENKQQTFTDPFEYTFFKNYEELSKNDWELHKQLTKEGHNPNEIVKIIRNDEIEKLQEISSQNDFDFNQIIEPSLYERYDFINQRNVTLIDYAAFFSAIKCFKFLLINGANVNDIGKYAIAGGNLEIIHLCEQNHASFDDLFEIAIKFHRNDIFKYIYDKDSQDENQSQVMNYMHFSNEFGDKNYNKIIDVCVKSGNYEIFSFIEKENQIDNFIINETAKIGNFYLVKHLIENNRIPKDILVFSSCSDNIELVKYILEQKDININEKDIFLLLLKFVLLI